MYILPFLLIFFSLLLFTTEKISANSSTTLDSTIRFYASKELSHAKTGILYQIPLPSNLSGIRASAIRLRSNSFYSKGVNSTAFKIPPKTLALPFAQRLVFIYQNLGNRSTQYYKTPGYALVSPVVGFLVYNASNMNELDVNTTSEGIIVNFQEVSLSDSSSRVKCVKFARNGSVEFGGLVGGAGCRATGSGHFAIVGPEVGGGTERRRRRRWWVWVVVGCGQGRSQGGAGWGPGPPQPPTSPHIYID